MKFEVENKDDVLKAILMYAVWDNNYSHHTAPTGAVKLVKDLVLAHYQIKPYLWWWHMLKASVRKIVAIVKNPVRC